MSFIVILVYTFCRWVSVGSDLKFDARRDLDDVGASCIEGIMCNTLNARMILGPYQGSFLPLNVLFFNEGNSVPNYESFVVFCDILSRPTGCC